MSSEENKTNKHSKNTLKISVIMPNYNNAKYIEEAINSVLEQTLQDIEVIVIDDCSTDTSIEILQKIQAKHPDKVKIVRNEVNLGAGLSRNAGIDIARGRFIKFLDADDTMDKDVLETMYNVATENNVKAVLGTVSIMGSSKKHDNYNVNNNDEIIDIQANKEDLVYGSCGVGDGLFAKELFDKIKFPKLKWEDLATIPALRVEAGNIYYIDKAVYNYRIHEQSTTGIDLSKKTPKVFDIVQCMDKIRKEIPKEYATEIDALAYMNYQLRMKEIASWDDCSADIKKILINSLNEIMKIQISDIDRNPYIKIVQSIGNVQINELKNGNYIQVGILNKEKTFERIQKKTKSYYKYMNKDRKKADENKVLLTSYIDKSALESEETLEESLSSIREADINEQCLLVLQEFEKLFNDPKKEPEYIIRESVRMVGNLISDKELMKKDKEKVITVMYKVLSKRIPNLDKMMQNKEEQLSYNTDDIDMYLDENLIQSNSVEEILNNVQKLLLSEEFLTASKYNTFSEQQIGKATKDISTEEKDEAKKQVETQIIQQQIQK